MQLELLPDAGPDVCVGADEPLEERHQLHQLVVRRVHEPGLDGDAVVDVVAKRLKQKKTFLAVIFPLTLFAM